MVDPERTYGFSRKLPREMTSAPTFDDFLRRWRAALRDGVNDKTSYWEGQQAYLDLKRSEHLDRVRLEEQSGDGKDFDVPKHPIAKAALWKIRGALSAYKRNIKRVRTSIEFQKDEEDWLNQQATAFRKRSARVAHRDPTLAGHLKQLAKRIDHTRREIRRRVRLQDRPHDTYLALVHPIKGHDKLQQERQLDSQFQVRLGAILRTYMQRCRDAEDKRLKGTVIEHNCQAGCLVPSLRGFGRRKGRRSQTYPQQPSDYCGGSPSATKRSWHRQISVRNHVGLPIQTSKTARVITRKKHSIACLRRGSESPFFLALPAKLQKVQNLLFTSS